MTPTHVLLTHHHHDHVEELGKLPERWPDLAGARHPDERVDGVTGEMGPGETRRASAASRCARCPPRATPRACSRCSSRATSSPATRCSRTRSAACARPATPPTPTSSTRSWTCCSRCRPRPSSAPATPSPRRWPRSGRHNAFVRVWRGLDPEGDEPCTAMGEPATLVLLGDDYDGGHKAWVRWPDGSRRHRRRARRSSRASGRRRALASLPRGGPTREEADPDLAPAPLGHRRAARRRPGGAPGRDARRQPDAHRRGGRRRRWPSASSRPPSRSSPRWGR